MKSLLKSTTLAALIAMLGTLQASADQKQSSETEGIIGVYDSRAIAVAFAGSPIHEKELHRLMKAHMKAKKAGDLDKVAKLQAEGKAMQKMAHMQAFSTAPVDDLLVHIAKDLPEIKKAAGVTAIVSKWDEAGLKKHHGAKRTDVTMKLVDAFDPNKRQRKSAVEIQKKKPIPLEQAEKLKD